MIKIVIVRIVTSGGGAERNLQNLCDFICERSLVNLEILTLSDYVTSKDSWIKKIYSIIKFLRVIRISAKDSTSIISSVEGYPFILIFISTLFIKTKKIVWLHCNPITYLSKINFKQRLLIIISILLSKHVIHASPVANDYKLLKNKVNLFLPNIRNNTILELINGDKIRNRLIYVGSFTEFKRPFLMVDILSNYLAHRNTVKNITVDFFGDGPLLSDVKNYVIEKKLPLDHFKFHGYIDIPWNKISNDSILISTSSTEALPMIFIEAISHGIPVICDDYHGSDFFTNANGLIFSCNILNLEEPIALINFLSKMKKKEYSKRLTSSIDFLNHYFDDMNNVNRLIDFCTKI